MKSKVLEKLISENNNLQDKDVREMLEQVKQSEYFPLFSEIMSNVKEEYFVDDIVHGITHNERVALYAFVIGLSENLSYNELKLTVLAAVYHDIGRKDAKGGEHGYRSAEILEENREDILPGISDEELNIIKVLSIAHAINDNEFDSINDLQKVKDKEQCRKMMKVLKDADALDRVRIHYGRLDENYLRTSKAKELVPIAKELFKNYKSIEHEQGLKVKSELFSLKNANVIEDEEYIYIFRTVNQDDEKILDDSNEEFLKSKIQLQDELDEKKLKYEIGVKESLEEIVDAVRVAGDRRQTNCISFSSNANVNLDFRNSRYVMMKIPKDDLSSIINVSEFLISETDKRLSDVIRTLKKDTELYSLIEKIEGAKNSEDIADVIVDYFKVPIPNQDNKKYTGNVSLTIPAIRERFERKDTLSEEAQLEYDKVIAKMTLFEITGKRKSIIEDLKNSILLSTIGVSFSAREVIHQGQIEKKDLTEISKDNVEMLALVQQLYELPNIDKTKISKMKAELIGLISNGYKLENTNGQIFFSNGENIIDLGEEKDFEEYISPTLDEFNAPDVESVLNYTFDENASKCIPYVKSIAAMEFMVNYARAQRRTLEYQRALTGVFGSAYATELERIKNETLSVSGEIISRRTNRGIRYADTVHFDMNRENREIFSLEEQKKVFEYVKQLDNDELRRLAQGDVTFFENKLLNNLLETEEYSGGRREYYANLIIDSIDFNKIYKDNTILLRDRIKKEKEELKNNLLKIDTERLYNALLKQGLSSDEISRIILNLVVEKNFRNIPLEELAQKEDLDGFIEENLLTFNRKISATVLDRLAGIKDEYEVDESTIILKEYQRDAVDKIDRIFKDFENSKNSNPEDSEEWKKRFAGVVLPTGAGKSFVAMTELLKHKDENIVYFAPQEEILNQVKKHILKNIIQKDIITDDDINKLVNMTSQERKEYLKNKVYNKGLKNIDIELDKLKNANETEILEIRTKFYPRETDANDDIMDEIKLVFPHLKMKCYQSLNGINDEEKRNKEMQELLQGNLDFVIFDEMHRTYADTWKTNIDSILKANKKAKILGVTATPIRDDADRINVMDEMAKEYGWYTDEQIMKKEHLAANMTLIDAMQDNLVVQPKIVSFKYLFKELEQYKYVEDRLEELKLKPEENYDAIKKLENIKSKMDAIIDVDINSKYRNEFANLAEVINQNIPESMKNGRFIVFLPQRSGNDTLKSQEDYMESKIEELRKYFEKTNENIETGYLISSRSDKTANKRVINEFENSNNSSLNLLFVINMLNEGVHVDGINGEFMFRKIGEDSNILYYQQIGRVIYAIDPQNPPREDEVPIIFDIYGNYISRDLDKVANMTTPTSDLQRLKRIIKWIETHGYIPDINSEDYEEARKAISLKKIQRKYLKYLEGINNNNLTESEIYEIEQIIKLAQSIQLLDRTESLFDIEFPERIIPPGERDLGSVRTFEVEGDAKKFLDLFKESKKVINGLSNNKKSISPTLRIRNNISNFLILQEYGLEISNETFKKVATQRKYENVKDVTFFDVIEYYFDDEIRKEILDELEMSEEEAKDFLDINGELEFLRNSFTDNEKRVRNVFTAYSIAELRKCGIFKENGKNIDRIVNERGFIHNENAPDVFKKIHIETETIYDSNGFNIDGYDKNLFRENETENKYGFRRDTLKHKDTGTHLDSFGFDIQGYYWRINPENPTERIKTDSFINDDGFDRDGGFWQKDEKGQYKLLFYTRLDWEFELIGGFTKSGYWCDYDKETKTVKRTNKKYNPRGFNFEGKHKDTGRKWNSDYFDVNGYYWEQDPDNPTQRRKTNKKYNEQFFDVDGYYWEEDPNDQSKRIKTNRKYNEENIDAYGKRCFFTKDKKTIYLIQNKNTAQIGGFDYSGNWWNYDEKTNTVSNSYQKYDSNGFKYSGINIDTGEVWNNEGFDIDGYYWKQDSKKSSKRIFTNTKYNGDYFDRDGYYWEQDQNDSSKRIKTERKYNEHFLDKDGYYWEQDPKDSSKRIKTDRKYSEDYFDKDGYYWEQDPNDSNKRIQTKRKYNEAYFDIDGYYWEQDLKKGSKRIKTDRQYNEDYLDKDGYYWEQDPNDPSKRIKSDKTYNEIYSKGFDNDGFDQYGFYKEDILRLNSNIRIEVSNLIFPQIYKKDCFRNEGGKYYYKNTDFEYSFVDGFNYYGYNKLGFNKKGVTRDKRNFIIKEAKYTKYKIDCHGCVIDTNNFLYKRFIGKFWPDLKNNYDAHYFDKDGNYWEQDSNDPSKRVKTNKKYNESFFDQDGYYWEQDSNNPSKRVKTERRFDENGFNIDGLDIHGFDVNGIHKDTGEKWDQFGFYPNGIHRVTNLKHDENGFIIDGINIYTNGYTDIWRNTQRDYIFNNKIDSIENVDSQLKNNDGTNREVMELDPTVRFTKYFLYETLVNGTSPKKLIEQIADRYKVDDIIKKYQKTHSDVTIQKEELMKKIVCAKMYVAFKGCPELCELKDNYLKSVVQRIQSNQIELGNEKISIQEKEKIIKENEKLENLTKELEDFIK